MIEHLSIGQTIGAAIDTPGDHQEIALVRQRVQVGAIPEPCRRHRGMVGPFKQLGLAQQIQTQRLPARFIVGPPRDLNQPTTTVKLAIAVCVGRVAQTQRQLTRVVLRQVTVVAQFTHVPQLAGLMTDLRDECRHAQPCVDAVASHRDVESRNENAGFKAGVGEDV